ncbi:ABC transporter ATP-binding protein [Acidiphilium sp. JA12-A1]|uniref:ABC transporter ATP-binding protein n=1 Tax=Acidiphilium sp. JA12-A1 TaxID=1464546 RepID=UPI000460EE91|nr:ABC transporter ATP-binding protein [Acidiphilium sp. JA12-A1]KDM66826.1 putative 2-aminoethylphosphonate import ATP-binding protein PhnT [Acidiphilium sp. JA12-A1]
MSGSATSVIAVPASCQPVSLDTWRAAPSRIALRGVTVRYGATTALDVTDLDVAAGEAVVLLGPSGSGKTTILRAIAGFVRPASGRIALSGRDVTDLPPYQRGLGMVVQNYALFPHMRVAANVGFGLRARRRPAAEIAERVAASLEMVGMGGFARRYPRELSGGQQQRVAIARALAIDPPVLLLDEPLSALDAPLRAGLIEEIRNLHARLPELAIVYVTHDQGEAIRLGHRIVLMREGRIAAQGTPRELHDTPPDRYVAEFFGQANLLPVTALARAGGFAEVALAGRRLSVRAPEERLLPDTPLLCIRPHAMMIEADADKPNRIEAEIVATRWMGAVHRLEVRIGPHVLRIDVPGNRPAPDCGARVALWFDPAQACLVADK